MTEQATELSRAFDPKKLPPGRYVAVAGSDAYAVLLGMAEAKVSKLEGERFLPTGEKAITVWHGQGGGGGRVANTSPGRIGIGREFFVTALKDYDDWPEKWWREAVQNAVDAKATQVALSVEQEGSLIRALCSDNGVGMDEDTILNRFLVLGGTTKVGAAGETGGFGKAKELLLLPWVKWRIHSRETVVEGAGIDYSVSRGSARKGTQLEVWMPQDQAVALKNAINFLGKCSIPGVRFSAGADTISANVRRGKLVETLAGKAEVYHNRNAERMGGMLIRINGIFMFNRWMDSSIPGTVFVELVGKSTDLLTANRDGIRDYELRRALDAFATRLAKDVSSALRGKRNLFTTRYRGAGLFEADGYDAREVAGAATAAVGGVRTAGSGKNEHVVLDKDQERALAEVLARWGGTGEASASGDRVDLGVAPVSLLSTFLSVVKGEVAYEHAVLQLAWKPDFLVNNEVEGFRVPKKFLPEGMTPTVLKLAKVWSELVRFVLIQLGSRAPFGVGWQFSEGGRASYYEYDNAKWILLNPFTKKADEQLGSSGYQVSSEIWNPNNEEHLKHLYAFAVHEATHLADGQPYHDESFSSALTFNMAKTVGGWKEAKKIAAAVKTRGGAKEVAPPRAPEASPDPVGFELLSSRGIPEGILASWYWLAYAASDGALADAEDASADPKRVAAERNRFVAWARDERSRTVFDPRPYITWASKAVPGVWDSVAESVKEHYRT